jgi:preprotein translocase subunit SecG
METNWITIILIITAFIIAIVFFFIRNRKDKNAFIQELIEEEEVSNPVVHDTEVDPSA